MGNDDSTHHRTEHGHKHSHSKHHLPCICHVRKGVYFPFKTFLHHFLFRMWCITNNTNISIPSHSWAACPIISYAIKSSSMIVIPISTQIFTVVFTGITDCPLHACTTYRTSPVNISTVAGS